MLAAALFVFTRSCIFICLDCGHILYLLTQGSVWEVFSTFKSKPKTFCFVFSCLWVSTLCVCVSFCSSGSAALDYNRDFCLPGCRSSGHLVELTANQHHLRAVLRQAFCFSGSWTNPWKAAAAPTKTSTTRQQRWWWQTNRSLTDHFLVVL